MTDLTKTTLYSATKRTRVEVTDLEHAVRLTVFRKRPTGRTFTRVDSQRFHHCSFERLVGLAERIASEAA